MLGTFLEVDHGRIGDEMLGASQERPGSVLGGELGEGGGEEVPWARSFKVDQYHRHRHNHPSRFSQSLGFRACRYQR